MFSIVLIIFKTDKKLAYIKTNREKIFNYNH